MKYKVEVVLDKKTKNNKTYYSIKMTAENGDELWASSWTKPDFAKNDSIEVEEGAITSKKSGDKTFHSIDVTKVKRTNIAPENVESRQQGMYSIAERTKATSMALAYSKDVGIAEMARNNKMTITDAETCILSLAKAFKSFILEEGTTPEEDEKKKEMDDIVGDELDF